MVTRPDNVEPMFLHADAAISYNDPMPLPELLAHPGGFDAAVAAFHYGAEAVYTGLDRFSARADAETSPDRLAALLRTRAAHPPRKVYAPFTHCSSTANWPTPPKPSTCSTTSASTA